MTAKPRLSVPMHPEEFELLRAFIRDQSGLVIHAEGMSQLARRLQPRLQARRLRSFAAYHRLLRGCTEGDDELQHLWDLVTNKETYFFREDYQLTAYRQQILPETAAARGHRESLTCWSMGCSTGEEVYSLAIVLLESGLFDGWDVRVYGSDISRSCLAVARRGVYGESSFRATSPARRTRFFLEIDHDLSVIPAVRSLCHFSQLNLAELPSRPVVEQVDAVFCRNVLIYFHDDARQGVVEAIYHRLRPGGYLFLGHSESLLNERTRFEVVHLEQDVAYRKPRSESPASWHGVPSPLLGNGRGM